LQQKGFKSAFVRILFQILLELEMQLQKIQLPFFVDCCMLKALVQQGKSTGALDFNAEPEWEVN